ncbi:hypothetical protein RFI_17856 [Reticulomyxa filosa]|uniref:Uncharacterized protein n=1 Tax=Reticulomyxa filosa TaxID=46433 RepID=X6N0Z6_RETFI|nr:hypothetical protein RFI_17856 [Reticulomyxa filosa]|eukprot:ETO19374.1 hypothetical protein RFI_17856 [Reticulomyxa filosa]
MMKSLDELCYVITQLPKCSEYIFCPPCSNSSTRANNVLSEYLYLMLHRNYNDDPVRHNAMERAQQSKFKSTPFPQMQYLEMTIEPPFRVDAMKWLCQLLRDHSTLRYFNLTVAFSTSSLNVNHNINDNDNDNDNDNALVLSLLEQLFQQLSLNTSLKKLRLSFQLPSSRSLKASAKQHIATVRKELVYLLLKHKQLKCLDIDLSSQANWRIFDIDQDIHHHHHPPPPPPPPPSLPLQTNATQISLDNAIAENGNDAFDMRPLLQMFNPKSTLYQQMYHSLTSMSTGAFTIHRLHSV